jgi:3',5'-cyclic AMP phosphodiesterase CpdA
LLLLLIPGLASAAAPFFFIQLSDPQFGMFSDNANFVQETANFEFAVASINRLHPAFVVITGDLVNKAGDTAQINEFKRILAKVNPDIPVHNVSGNHDVGNEPTPQSVAAFTNQFGPDHYTFRHHDFVGIVLNSSLIKAPAGAQALFTEQEHWLEGELEKARQEGAHHIVIFQHHPWFLTTPDEPDQYFNLPTPVRTRYLALFKKYNVRYVFCGHYHRNSLGHDGSLEMITNGATGKPLGDKSGMRIAIVRPDGIEHQFYSLGEIPDAVHLTPPARK